MKKIILASLCIFALAFSACGGGGGSDSTASATPTFTVSGNVTQKTGSENVGNIVVYLFGNGSTLMAMTANDGSYEISGVKAGSYTILPSKSGYIFTPATQIFEVSADTSAPAIEAELDTSGVVTTYQVSGRITDINNNTLGLPNIKVYLFGSGDGKLVETDENGYYTFTGVTAGSYVVKPENDGFYFTPDRYTVTVLNANINVNTFTGSETYTLNGTISQKYGDEDVSNVIVYLFGNGVTLMAMTDSDGDYTITGIKPGEYTIFPTKEGIVFDPTTTTVTISGDTTAPVIAGEEDTAGGVITHRVSGRITRVNSTVGIPNMYVYIFGNGDSKLVITDDNGNYSFTAMIDGEYVVKPDTENYVYVPNQNTVTVAGADVTVTSFEAAQVNNAIIDPWGYKWDSVIRGPQTWAQANDLCGSLGGRLPTPTEIYRSNASNKGGGIGSYANTEWLWTNIQQNVDQYVVVRFNDGATSYIAPTGSTYFRCVWPDREYDHFTGTNVYTNPGESGYVTSDGRYVIDTYERARLSYNAAARECAFYHAHLTPQSFLVEAIQDGLPNGNDLTYNTSDHTGYTGDQFTIGVITKRLVTPQSSYNDYYSANASWGYNYEHNNRYFRCVGLNRKPAVHARSIADEWIGDANGTYLKTTAHDIDKNADGDNNPSNPDQINMLTATMNCYNDGGHLPTAEDMTMLVQAGLPNGTNSWLWTSDYTSDVNTTIVRWLNVDFQYTGFYDRNMTWSGHAPAQLQNYRCVYYPVDTTYTGPSSSDCNGGCWSKSVTNDGLTVTTWVDTYDRTAANYHIALRDCYIRGGHLPSHRDMVELIKSGLPNGNNAAPVWTSDMAAPSNAEVVQWKGVEAGFDDQARTLSTNVSGSSELTRNTTTEQPYRCVWTNELRIK